MKPKTLDQTCQGSSSGIVFTALAALAGAIIAAYLMEAFLTG